MKDGKQKAAAAAAAFDEAGTGASVVKGVLAEWRETSADVVLAAGAEHSRGLQGPVRLALHVLRSTPHAHACTQLLAMLALCPPVQTPWSLFDGGGAAQACAGCCCQCRREKKEGRTWLARLTTSLDACRGRGGHPWWCCCCLL